MTKHFACVFLARRNQYTNVGKMFLFLKLTHIKFLPPIVVTNRHSIVIAAERSVITLVVNMTTCKYNWKGLNESAFPAHSYLITTYFETIPTVNFTVDFKQGVFIDRFHRITKTYNFKAPTLVTSASHKITAKCGILCPKTLLLTEKQLHTRHFSVATCNDPIILCA